MPYTISDEEREYLKNYDISAFPRPSLTADIAIFAIRPEVETDRNYRRDPALDLSLLLIRRGQFPYKNCWALPGGFVRPDETINETAFRELKEETALSHAFLQPFGMFSEPGRDPRGWIVSQGFLALVDSRDYQLRAGTDAWDAQWFRIGLTQLNSERKFDGQDGHISTRYALELTCRSLDIRILARLKEERSFTNCHESSALIIEDNGGLAFDHARIIFRAFLSLRQQTENDGRIVFDLMPPLFTLNMLQDAYEAILGKPLLAPNFRRKIAPLVLDAGETSQGAGHRPARLYKRNLEAFYQ